MSSKPAGRFDATIEAADRGGAFVAVPAEVVAALGGYSFASDGFHLTDDGAQYYTELITNVLAIP